MALGCGSPIASILAILISTSFAMQSKYVFPTWIRGPKDTDRQNQNVVAGASSTPGAEGVGLEKALEGYASWFKNTYLPGSEFQ